MTDTIEEAHDRASAFTTVDRDQTFPFVEDENCNVTGYGHQDVTEFAEAIARWDLHCGATDELDLEDTYQVCHDWAIEHPSDDERLFTVHPETGEPVTAGTPGAYPITCVWGQR